MTETATVSLEAIGLAYLKAWHTTDASERRALLEQCWADEGVYQDPNKRVEGRMDLLANIESFHQRLPGDSFKLASGVDGHHGMLRFRWTWYDADGKPRHEGFDIGELDADGRLKRITGFFGPFPEPPAHVAPELVDHRRE